MGEDAEGKTLDEKQKIILFMDKELEKEVTVTLEGPDTVAVFTHIRSGDSSRWRLQSKDSFDGTEADKVITGEQAAAIVALWFAEQSLGSTTTNELYAIAEPVFEKGEPRLIP